MENQRGIPVDPEIIEGISKLAWGFLFILFDFNLNFSSDIRIDIMPDIIGYLLFWAAFAKLARFVQGKKYLPPAVIGLAVFSVLDYFVQWGDTMLGPVLIIFIGLVTIYVGYETLGVAEAVAAEYKLEKQKKSIHDTRMLYLWLSAAFYAIWLLSGEAEITFDEIVGLLIFVVVVVLLVMVVSDLFGLRNALLHCQRDEDVVSFAGGISEPGEGDFR
ncbi:MAG: hypothetical protein II483_00155 [Lachnospiraceae bacterium]|nr:hypothetical protein [Lachnospiraceae bacterium]